MDNKNKIEKFLKSNYGYIFTSELLSLGINKPMIKKYVDNGMLRKVSHGLYMDSNKLQDDEYIF